MAFILKKLENHGGSGGGLKVFSYDAGTDTKALVKGANYFNEAYSHLQRGIPAVVWDICPDFPSAESLGTFVNTAQTATNYFDLIEQDPGDRVIRPDLVTDYTPTYWVPTADNE